MIVIRHLVSFVESLTESAIDKRIQHSLLTFAVSNHCSPIGGVS